MPRIQNPKKKKEEVKEAKWQEMKRREYKWSLRCRQGGALMTRLHSQLEIKEGTLLSEPYRVTFAVDVAVRGRVA